MTSKDITLKILEVQMLLIESHGYEKRHDIELFMNSYDKCKQWLQPAHYEEIIEERANDERCAYPACNQKLHSTPISPDAENVRYRIDYKNKAIYQIDQSNLYCSQRCLENSAIYKATLDTSSVFMRKGVKEYFNDAGKSTNQGNITNHAATTENSVTTVTAIDAKLEIPGKSPENDLSTPTTANLFLSDGSEVEKVFRIIGLTSPNPPEESQLAEQLEALSLGSNDQEAGNNIRHEIKHDPIPVTKSDTLPSDYSLSKNYVATKNVSKSTANSNSSRNIANESSNSSKQVRFDAPVTVRELANTNPILQNLPPPPEYSHDSISRTGKVTAPSVPISSNVNATLHPSTMPADALRALSSKSQAQTDRSADLPLFRNAPRRLTHQTESIHRKASRATKARILDKSVSASVMTDRVIENSNPTVDPKINLLLPTEMDASKNPHSLDGPINAVDASGKRDRPKANRVSNIPVFVPDKDKNVIDSVKADVEISLSRKGETNATDCNQSNRNAKISDDFARPSSKSILELLQAEKQLASSSRMIPSHDANSGAQEAEYDSPEDDSSEVSDGKDSTPNNQTKKESICHEDWTEPLFDEKPSVAKTYKRKFTPKNGLSNSNKVSLEDRKEFSEWFSDEEQESAT